MTHERGGSGSAVGASPDHDTVRPTTGPTPDPFFAVEAENEDEPVDIAIPTIDIVAQRVKRSFDNYQCPIIVVVDITGIHQLRVRLPL